MHEKVFADPLNEHITTSSFWNDVQELREKIKSYKKFPLYKSFLYLFLLLLPIFAIIYSIDKTAHLFYIIPLLVLGIIWYNMYLQSLQQEVITLLLCERNNFVFNPVKNHVRALKFRYLFPDIFDRGDPKTRYVDNQIWGNGGQKRDISFWSGVFHYETNAQYDENGVERKDFMPGGSVIEKSNLYSLGEAIVTRRLNYHENSDRDEQVFEKQAFIFELGRIMPTSFVLFTHGLKRDLTTESVEFNQKFTIRIHSKSKSADAQTLQALSPSVQIRLVEFAEKFSIDCIAFQHNCMVVLFAETGWKTKFTHFFKTVDIDDRDLQRFDELLNEMIALPVEMRKFLD